MKEKLLEKRLKRPLTSAIRKNIKKRLVQLRKDFTKMGEVSYSWSKEKDVLFVKTVNLKWVLAFRDKRMTIWVDVPFLAIPFVQPYKKMALDIIKEEIDKLIK